MINGSVERSNKNNIGRVAQSEERIKTPKGRIKTSTSMNITGKIANTIGTGDNAKNSIVYLTIKWAFIASTVVTVIIATNYWCFREREKVPDFTNDIKIIWEIVVPLITLTLGYAFGKAEK